VVVSSIDGSHKRTGVSTLDMVEFHWFKRFHNVLYVMGSLSWGLASVFFFNPFEHEGIVFLLLKFEVSFSYLCVFLRVRDTTHFTSYEMSTLIIFCHFAFLHGF